ncbi:homogentisate 1,2-dioxygenase [Sesbania bispinosa]|nr:homogentisate 1,2-dioxygenase [Sesbania bispinosa]
MGLDQIDLYKNSWLFRDKPTVITRSDNPTKQHYFVQFPPDDSEPNPHSLSPKPSPEESELIMDITCKLSLKRGRYSLEQNEGPLAYEESSQ